MFLTFLKFACKEIMSAVQASHREQIVFLVRLMTVSEEQFDAFNEKVDKKLYDFGRNVFQKIEETDDLLEMISILQAFQMAIAPILDAHRQLEEEVQKLEGKIASLLPMDG